MEELLKKTFGIPVKIRSSKAPKGLPFYMTNERKFYQMEMAGIATLLIELPDTDKFGVVAYNKQLQHYIEKSGMPAAYVFSSLKRVQRDALIEKGIPFICIPEQIYLPFLGVVLSSRFVQQKAVPDQKMTPVTQMLFLYFLYKAGADPVMKKQAAEELNISRMSVTRASEQLQAMGLIIQEAHGKEMWMKAISAGKEYYRLAEPFLIDPVQRTITTGKSQFLTGLPSAGETALSMHSMLNGPSIPVVAAYKQNNNFQETEIIDEKWQPEKDLVRVELWKYDPELFALDGCVDPVSLAASLKDVCDERVEGELEDYLEGWKW